MNNGASSIYSCGFHCYNRHEPCLEKLEKQMFHYSPGDDRINVRILFKCIKNTIQNLLLQKWENLCARVSRGADKLL